MSGKKEKEDLEPKMSASKRASLRRKSSMMEEVKKKGAPGSLFKPKESKPYKKTLTAAEIRAQENSEALRKLSMVKITYFNMYTFHCTNITLEIDNNHRCVHIVVF